MDNLLVVSALESKANFATVESLSGLGVGKLIAIGDGRKIIGSDAVEADLADIKEIQFVTKLNSTGKLRMSVLIPRYNVNNIINQNYTASQAQIQRLGGITEDLALNIDTTGEALITIVNKSYNHAINTQRVAITRTKRASETPTDFMTALVASINAAASAQAVPFFSAALINDAGGPPATYFGINFTTLGDNVDMDIYVGGMFEGASIVQTQAQKVSLGKGTDVLAMEKDMQTNFGNNNYVELTDLWYLQPTETAGATNYDNTTIAWKGIATTATTARHVMNNTLAIFTPTAGNITAIRAWLQVIFGNTYVLAAGAEVVTQADVDATNATVSKS